MKKLLNFILFIGFIGFLYVTCPDDSAHAEALSEALPEYFCEQLGGSELGDELSDLTDDPAMLNFIKALAPKLVVVDNYLLVSIGREKLSGEDNVISVGMCGHVFTFKDEIVNKGVPFLKGIEDNALVSFHSFKSRFDCIYKINPKKI